jgi:hypothetical protein
MHAPSGKSIVGWRVIALGDVIKQQISPEQAFSVGLRIGMLGHVWMTDKRQTFLSCLVSATDDDGDFTVEDVEDTACTLRMSPEDAHEALILFTNARILTPLIGLTPAAVTTPPVGSDGQSIDGTQSAVPRRPLRGMR